MAIILIIAVIVIIVLFCRSETKYPAPPPTKVQMRCPSCGAPVIVCGDTWECPYCTDCGKCRRKG